MLNNDNKIQTQASRQAVAVADKEIRAACYEAAAGVEKNNGKTRQCAWAALNNAPENDKAALTQWQQNRNAFAVGGIYQCGNGYHWQAVEKTTTGRIRFICVGYAVDRHPPPLMPAPVGKRVLLKPKPIFWDNSNLAGGIGNNSEMAGGNGAPAISSPLFVAAAPGKQTPQQEAQGNHEEFVSGARYNSWDNNGKPVVVTADEVSDAGCGEQYVTFAVGKAYYTATTESDVDGAHCVIETGRREITVSANDAVAC